MRLNVLSLSISLAINNVPVDEVSYHLGCNQFHIPAQPQQRAWWNDSLTQDDYEKLMAAQAKRMRRGERNRRLAAKITETYGIPVDVIEGTVMKAEDIDAAAAELGLKRLPSHYNAALHASITNDARKQLEHLMLSTNVVSADTDGPLFKSISAEDIRRTHDELAQFPQECDECETCGLAIPKTMTYCPCGNMVHFETKE